MNEVKTKGDRAKFYASKEWQAIRQEALERDNRECQWCKEKGKVTTRSHEILEVDHIKELEDYPEYSTELWNLRTLCKECHNKRHNRFGYNPESKKKFFNDERWD